MRVRRCASRSCRTGTIGQWYRFCQSALSRRAGLDYLSSPTGVIAEAQALAAHAYGADNTWFLVQGSTVGIQVVLLAALRRCSSFAGSGCLHDPVSFQQSPGSEPRAAPARSPPSCMLHGVLLSKTMPPGCSELPVVRHRRLQSWQPAGRATRYCWPGTATRRPSPPWS